MRRQRKPFRHSVALEGTGALEPRDATVAEPPARAINVRAAKDGLSGLLEEAARGNEIVITSDGEPKARLVAVRRARKPFRVDWAWLESQPVSAQALAEDVIRADREGRG